MLHFYMQTLETPEDKYKFEQIYINYCNLMFYVADNLLHNKYDTEDAVHQAFVSIAENIDKIDEPVSSKTKAYVVTIAEHKALDILRQSTRHPCSYMDDTALDSATLHKAKEYCKENKLSQCILMLPANYREVILLRYFHGYSTKEIAQILDTTEANALKLNQRAKNKLYELCKEEHIL